MSPRLRRFTALFLVPFVFGFLVAWALMSSLGAWVYVIDLLVCGPWGYYWGCRDRQPDR